MEHEQNLVLNIVREILITIKWTNLLNCLQENGDISADDGMHRGVQYPFSVNEKVIIKVSSFIILQILSDLCASKLINVKC